MEDGARHTVVGASTEVSTGPVQGAELLAIEDICARQGSTREPALNLPPSAAVHSHTVWSAEAAPDHVESGKWLRFGFRAAVDDPAAGKLFRRGVGRTGGGVRRVVVAARRAGLRRCPAEA